MVSNNKNNLLIFIIAYITKIQILHHRLTYPPLQQALTHLRLPVPVDCVCMAEFMTLFTGKFTGNVCVSAFCVNDDDTGEPPSRTTYMYIIRLAKTEHTVTKIVLNF